MNENPSEADVKADWETRGFGFDCWSDPPGRAWEDFVHDVDELVMLVEGEIELSLDGRTVRPQVWQEALIPAGARHTVRNTGATRNRWCFGYKAQS